MKDPKRYRRLQVICEKLGDPCAIDFTAKMFADYRALRLIDASANTANRDLAYLRAVLNELIRACEWINANPLIGIRKLRVDEKELGWLSIEQVTNLLNELDPTTTVPVCICLATGVRWGEVCDIKAEQILAGKITFAGTKLGRVRAIHLNGNIVIEYVKR